MPHDPEIRKIPYPGRTELDTANRRFRKSIARLHREGLRTNKTLIPVVAAIVEDATTTLDRLAGQAETTTYTEPARRKALQAVRRTGSPRAAEILARLNGGPPEEQLTESELEDRAWALLALAVEGSGSDVGQILGRLPRGDIATIAYVIAGLYVGLLAGDGTYPVAEADRAQVLAMIRGQLLARAAGRDDA